MDRVAAGCGSWLHLLAATLALVAISGCGSSGHHASASPTPTQSFTPTASPTATPSPTPAPFIAVLSAFPGEMAPVLGDASIDQTVTIEGRDNRFYRVGTLNGVHVVIGLTGIGLVNAMESTRAILDQFPVTGVVVSAVAGSSVLIGDVTVPQTWTLIDADNPNGLTFGVDPNWYAIAQEIAAPGVVALEQCTDVPSKSPDPICVLGQPVIIVGGAGQSSDPFTGHAVPCTPGGDDVSGCDVPGASTAAENVGQAVAAPASLDTDMPIAEDMETAAIVREVTARGLPFIAFRAVSDGAGDPLGLPGFPSQFFVYYHLSADNAAAATAAFLERLSGAPPSP